MPHSKKSVDIADRPDQVAKMRDAGYISVTEITASGLCTRTTVHRWAAEGLFKSEIVANNMYVELSSFIAYLGENKAKIFGFIKKKAGGAK